MLLSALDSRELDGMVTATLGCDGWPDRPGTAASANVARLRRISARTGATTCFT